MTTLRHIALTVVALMCLNELSAQVFISRAALDELVSPALSDVAEGVLSTTSRVCDVGEIYDNDVVRVSYIVQNRHSEAVAITALRASCSCLKVTSARATLSPDESYTLTAEFNPAGRSGGFSYDIDIYTALDDSHPTERVTLRGVIRSTDAFGHLTEAMGLLRMSRKSVTIESVKSGTTRREHIAVANSGTKALRLRAQTTIEGLSIAFKPALLEPDMEGEIVVEYCPEVLPERDIATFAIVEGLDAPATERMIRITIKR